MPILKEFTKGYIPPVQNQDSAPGSQRKLDPQPIDDITADGKPYKAAGKLEGRKVIITGADSGIGRSIALLFGESFSRFTMAAALLTVYISPRRSGLDDDLSS